MRIALVILITIHGIIHLFGFLKGFGLSEFNAIQQPISKTMGILWLSAFLLFILTAVQLILKANYWWLAGCCAIVISQILIFNYWSDAKFGTIANLIILVALIIGFSSFSFKKQIAQERKNLFQNSENISQTVMTSEAISDLPPIVQKWLMHSGAVGKTLTSNVQLTQELLLKMKPEDSAWSRATAKQFFTVEPPAFNWSISAQMNSILKVTGRDKFEHGKGEMNIKLFSLFPVADAKNHNKVDQATLQRYLAEIVWFPSASLSSYMTWESLGEYSARATMEFNGTKGSGEFYFDKKGNFNKFVAMRYQDIDAKKPTEWTVIATKIKEFNGIKIPVECEASWKLKQGKWTWLKLKISDIRYNLNEMPGTTQL